MRSLEASQLHICREKAATGHTQVNARAEHQDFMDSEI